MPMSFRNTANELVNSPRYQEATGVNLRRNGVISRRVWGDATAVKPW